MTQTNNHTEVSSLQLFITPVYDHTNILSLRKYFVAVVKFRCVWRPFNFQCGTCLQVPVPVAARYKAEVFGRSPAEIVGSNPAGGMVVFLL